MRTFIKSLPHICAILAGTFLTLLIVDKFNAEMAFINNGIAKTLLLVFCLVAIAVSLMQMLLNERTGR